MENRKLSFPPSSIGVLLARALGSQKHWSILAEAIGDIVIPTGQEARLEVSPTAVFEPSIFSDLGPEALSEFQWVSTSKVTDAGISHIQHLTGLRGLALWETNIGDEALWHLGNLSILRWLDIGDTKITAEGLASLRELSSLSDLALLNDRIGNDGLMRLQDLTSLRGLDLMNTSVTDEGAKTLSKMAQLKRLRIVGTGITDRGYARLKTALPGCQIKYHHPHQF